MRTGYLNVMSNELVRAIGRTNDVIALSGSLQSEFITFITEVWESLSELIKLYCQFETAKKCEIWNNLSL